MKFRLLLSSLLFTTWISGQNPDKYNKIIDSLGRIGQQDALIPYFQKELQAFPKSEMVLRWLGYLYIGQNEFEIGEKYYKEALVINPKCGRCYMNIGRIYQAKNESKTALELFNRSIDADPKDAILYSARASLKEHLNDITGALADFNKSIELDPASLSYFIQRGNYYAHQNNFSEALADYNIAIELAPNNFEPYFRRASIYYTNQMPQEALADINTAIHIDSTQQMLYAGRGSIHEVLKEYKMAIEDYSKAISLNSNDFYPYRNRAAIKYRLEDLDGSCLDYFKVLELIKNIEISDTLLINEVKNSVNDYCDSSKSGFYYQRGLAFYNLRQYQSAVDIYSKGLKKFPQNSMALSFRGNSYMALKEYKKALDSYMSALESKENLMTEIKMNPRFAGATPESVKLYYNGSLASIHLSIAQCKFALGLNKEALVAIKKGITLAPDIKEFGKEEYYNLSGNILIALGKFENAIKDFDACLNLNSNFSLAYVNRALAKIGLSDKIKMNSFKIAEGISNYAFTIIWELPHNALIKESNANILSALDDCNKAIESNPQLAYAFYIRGRIEKLLFYSTYCKDFIKANELGFSVDVKILNDCGK